MMRPKQIAIANYTYSLPDDKVALYPLQERDMSKLLVYKEGIISEDIYKNIARHLPEDCLLVLNNTKVIQARILFSKPSGATIELFLLEPFEDNNEYSTVMNKTNSVHWKCMIGGASKWKTGSLGKEININNRLIILKAELKQKLSDAYVAEFSWQPSYFSFVEIIENFGETPLPPYIKRKANENDKERYQTIYARQEGSVAAPTAGLHFTDEVFSSLKEKRIKTGSVTLHVGAGTFKPVKSETIANHEMHAEWMDISTAVIENLLENLPLVIAVGTTSLRTLESIYWMGIKAHLQPGGDEEYLTIKQWEVYEAPLMEQKLNVNLVLQSLLTWMKNRGKAKLFIKTQIIIVPGYEFKIVKGLITNFHQPKSTLLLLVAALTGDNWRKIYEYALQNNFRFLSYGDGCLIMPTGTNSNK
jgi:S-adenosylmethionine:tRNA ribosyltransferase-isomerase